MTSQFTETESRMVVARSGGKEKCRVMVYWVQRVSVWEDKKNSGDGRWKCLQQ